MNISHVLLASQLLVEHYGPEGSFWVTHSGREIAIRAWEIGNEPNLQRFSVGSAKDYQRILRAARQGLRSADSRARIIFGGLSSVTNKQKLEGKLSADQFLREVLHSRGRCLVDAVAYHPYGPTPEEAAHRAGRFVIVTRKEMFNSGLQRSAGAFCLGLMDQL